MLLETDVRESQPCTGSTSPAGLAGGRPDRRRRSARLRSHGTPLLLMVAGVAVIAVAAMVLISSVASVSGDTGEPAPAFGGVALGGPGDVMAQMSSYAPGQSSGWHSHTGLHAVVVLSGTLTIVDGECRRQTYGPGDSYVGGRDVHVALNESHAVLDMTVTYLFPAGVSHTGFHIPVAAPPNCEIR